MPTASNKDWKAAEREVANYLRSLGYENAKTSRAELGHMGTRQPGDITGVPGHCIEVKARYKVDIGATLRKLETDCPEGFRPSLWIRPYRVSNPAEWWTVMYGRHLTELWSYARNDR